MKQILRERAINLRQKGFSYSEILKEVPVAKSTLSLWLRSVGLSKKQKQRLTDKKLAAIKKGWLAWSQERSEKTEQIIKNAKLEVKKASIDKNKLWIMGIMLYWAEGSKQKKENISQGVVFSNSDPKMIKVFLKWLVECLKIILSDIQFDIYIHETHKDRLKEVSEYWSKITGFPINKFGKIYYKKHKPNSNRKNIGINYFGLLRVKVVKSTDLNRKIAAWTEAICDQCGVV